MAQSGSARAGHMQYYPHRISSRRRWPPMARRWPPLTVLLGSIPIMVRFWLRKGEAHRGLGQQREALAAYDRALELGLGHAMVWFGKGWAHDALGQNQEALTAFDRYLALAPDDIDIW